ncbi:MAG: LysR family transcriptional regulator [Terriglobales bacterium]
MDKLAAMSAFVHIVERGSLTAAAEALDTSLPSVVRTLAALERHLGVRLLNRTTRRIHLTDEGAQYLERCRAVLSAVAEAEAMLASRRADPQGRLAVTASVLFGRRYLAPIVSEFITCYPGVNVDLLLLDRVVNLVEEGMDVGVRIGLLSDSSLVAIPVGQVRRVICASADYLRRHGTPRAPEDLRRHRCVSFTAVTPGNDWHLRAGRRDVAVLIARAMSCNQVDVALEACVEGLGLGRFLSYQVAPYCASQELRYVLEEFEPASLPVQLIYPHTKLLSTTVRAFVDACVTTLRQTSFH